MVSRPHTLNEQDLRDLGFGSVVSRESHQRLLNRDGSFNVERKGLTLLESLSPYHVLLTMPWWQFFLLGVGCYVLVNVLFALAYLACGVEALVATSPGVSGRPFWRAFFFSIETLSTIGYGNIVPVNLAANVVVGVEALTGLAGFAIATGLLFARISRPTANVLFSSHAVVAPYQGISALEFRVANARSNELIEGVTNLSHRLSDHAELTSIEHAVLKEEAGRSEEKLRALDQTLTRELGEIQGLERTLSTTIDRALEQIRFSDRIAGTMADAAAHGNGDAQARPYELRNKNASVPRQARR